MIVKLPDSPVCPSVSSGTVLDFADAYNALLAAASGEITLESATPFVRRFQSASVLAIADHLDAGRGDFATHLGQMQQCIEAVREMVVAGDSPSVVTAAVTAFAAGELGE